MANQTPFLFSVFLCLFVCSFVFLLHFLFSLVYFCFFIVFIQILVDKFPYFLFLFPILSFSFYFYSYTPLSIQFPFLIIDVLIFFRSFQQRPILILLSSFNPILPFILPTPTPLYPILPSFLSLSPFLVSRSADLIACHVTTDLILVKAPRLATLLATGYLTDITGPFPPFPRVYLFSFVLFTFFSSAALFDSVSFFPLYFFFSSFTLFLY